MITAKIIADSISEKGKRITTFELEYPRFIHSELMTHRMLSRNAASSRAIPVNTMIGLVWSNPAQPVHWGKNQAGMQAKEELTGFRLWATKKIWNVSGKVACGFAWILNKVGCHKQIVNRITEPWSHIKVVATATEWDNFFYLRNHPDAQPEIHELARIMWDLYKNSTPKELKEGEWHLPYISSSDGKYYTTSTPIPIAGFPEDKPMYKVFASDEISLEDAKKLSASLCAQTSFRKADESVDKAIRIYDRLVVSRPVHSSPFEHQATPSDDPELVSGNLRGWFQFRESIDGNVCFDYDGSH
jgi:hypothetical protein